MIFSKEHIEKILNGTKTATRRFWKKWMAKEGGSYAAQSYRGQCRKECPIILVQRRYMQRLGDMTSADAKKEGGYTLKQFKKIAPQYFKQDWDDELVPHVLEFRLLSRPTTLDDFPRHEVK